MRCVIPYVPGMLAERAVTALREQSDSVEIRDVSGSPVAYWELLAQLWRECAESGDDLMLVEQDVVVAAGTIAALDECSHGWCACPPRPRFLRQRPRIDTHNGWSIACLTANRWRSEFIADHADCFERVDPLNRHWSSLDGHSIGTLDAQVHVHARLRTQHWHRQRVGWQPSDDDNRVAAALAYQDAIVREEVNRAGAEF